MVKDGSIQVSHLSTLSNPADIYTKHLRTEDLQKHLFTIGFLEKALGYMVERAAWAKPWKKPKMTNAVLCFAVTLATVAGDSMDDEEDGSTAFWKAMVIWTAVCILIGMISGAALWARCCTRRVKTGMARSIQTDEVIAPPVPETPVRATITHKPTAVYSTSRGEKMHLYTSCPHVRGRTAKVHEVCLDCLR